MKSTLKGLFLHSKCDIAGWRMECNRWGQPSFFSSRPVLICIELSFGRIVLVAKSMNPPQLFCSFRFRLVWAACLRNTFKREFIVLGLFDFFFLITNCSRRLLLQKHFWLSLSYSLFSGCSGYFTHRSWTTVNYPFHRTSQCLDLFFYHRSFSGTNLYSKVCRRGSRLLLFSTDFTSNSIY